MNVTVYFENQNEEKVTYKLKMLIRRAIEQTLACEQYGNELQLSVTLTDDEGIRELNARFRGIDAPTDVLSFPLFDYEGDCDEPPIDELGMENMLGDIVLNLDRARAQADEFGHSFEREVAFLTVHSMLHLLGYDHERSAEDDEAQCAAQREIMDTLEI